MKDKPKIKLKMNIKKLITRENLKQRMIQINIKNIKREITIILVIGMVLILFFTGYSFGKGFSETTINANTQVAEPILQVDAPPDIVNLTTVDGRENYEFNIKNYDELGNINQVDLNYNIEIISDADYTIKFRLLKDGQEIRMTNRKTENMVLGKSIKEDNNFKLQVYFGNYTPELEDELANVQIKVHSEQVKN